MGALIRFRSKKEDNAFEITIGLSRGVVIGMIAVVMGAVSLGYAVMPVQSQEQAGRGRKAVSPLKYYSEAVEAGDYVFLSGKIATSQGKVIEGGIKEETKVVLENLKTALAKSGLTLDDVVRTTVYLNKLEDYAAMNEVYLTYFPKDPPARSTVQAGVVLGASVEIDVIAYRGSK
jgi:reactive intermediate/imine deaminase